MVCSVFQLSKSELSKSELDGIQIWQSIEAYISTSGIKLGDIVSSERIDGNPSTDTDEIVSSERVHPNGCNVANETMKGKLSI